MTGLPVMTELGRGMGWHAESQLQGLAVRYDDLDHICLHEGALVVLAPFRAVGGAWQHVHQAV
jgi:hypothetical protein